MPNINWAELLKVTGLKAFFLAVSLGMYFKLMLPWWGQSDATVTVFIGFVGLLMAFFIGQAGYSFVVSVETWLADREERQRAEKNLAKLSTFAKNLLLVLKSKNLRGANFLTATDTNRAQAVQVIQAVGELRDHEVFEALPDKEIVVGSWRIAEPYWSILERDDWEILFTGEHLPSDDNPFSLG